MKEKSSLWLKRALSIGVASATLATSVLMFASCGKKDDESTEPSENETTTVQAANVNPLTGESDYNASAVGKRPYAIVVENHPSARPQWGLCTPDIVIEGLVEGGISRMLWLYSDVDSIPDQVGPIRSARVDYVEMAAAYDAIYIHWGGATTSGISAYDKIKQLSVDDIDGISYEGKYFGRSSKRASRGSEHTGYTTGEMIKSAVSNFGYRTDLKDSYKNLYSFNATAASLAGGACNSIKTGFSDSYMHTFKYNADDGLYYNYMNTAEMVDADGKQMAVSNVFVLFADYSIVDSIGHVNYDLSAGTGYYVSNGTYMNIKWSKGNGGTEPLKFFDENGNALSVNTGKSWIGLVPTKMKSATVIA